MTITSPWYIVFVCMHSYLLFLPTNQPTGQPTNQTNQTNKPPGGWNLKWQSLRVIVLHLYFIQCAVSILTDNLSSRVDYYLWTRGKFVYTNTPMQIYSLVQLCGFCLSTSDVLLIWQLLYVGYIELPAAGALPWGPLHKKIILVWEVGLVAQSQP